MKVTVCELSDGQDEFLLDWQGLKAHVAENRPELVVLPEMPFCKWIAVYPKLTAERRLRGIDRHYQWLSEIEALGVSTVVYSMPVLEMGKYLNIAYVYRLGVGHQRLDSKAYFPQEPHFWERTWFSRPEPVTFDSADIGNCRVGVLLCTEL